MAKVLIVYYSCSGNTEKMAEAVREGVIKEGVDVEMKSAENATPDDMLKADGIIAGSPTYFGLPAGDL